MEEAGARDLDSPGGSGAACHWQQEVSGRDESEVGGSGEAMSAQWGCGWQSFGNPRSQAQAGSGEAAMAARPNQSVKVTVRRNIEVKLSKSSAKNGPFQAVDSQSLAKVAPGPSQVALGVRLHVVREIAHLGHVSNGLLSPCP